VSVGVHKVGFLVFDGVKMLDVAGPAEVFAEANLSGSANYEISMISSDGREVRTSIGVRLPVDSSAADVGRIDTLVVPGGEVFPSTIPSEDLTSAAHQLATRATKTASVCTGAFVLGAAGLLDGKRATTHWKHTKELGRRYPKTRVEPDAIFVKDQATYSSAGVTAGIDLALALLEEDHGEALTRETARSLVVYMQRAGGQSQFSANLEGRGPKSGPLRRVTDAVKANPSGDYSVHELSRLASVSPRHLTRLFHEELQTTPAKYVELIRFDSAKALLDAGYNVTAAAQRAGFGTSEALRRAFNSHLSVSPSSYKGRFTSTSLH
jgi:transcriptional regulator GlxA family with amidase domain